MAQLSYSQTVMGQPPGDPSVQAMRGRHGGRWEIGLCDAHVENLRGVDVFNIGNLVVARRWNMDDQAHVAGSGPPPD